MLKRFTLKQFYFNKIKSTHSLSAFFMFPILIPNISFLFIPINYPTTFDTKFIASKKESFTNSFANTGIGLFSIQSKT